MVGAFCHVQKNPLSRGKKRGLSGVNKILDRERVPFERKKNRFGVREDAHGLNARGGRRRKRKLNGRSTLEKGGGRTRKKGESITPLPHTGEGKFPFLPREKTIRGFASLAH